jgi:hypothetical protein
LAPQVRLDQRELLDHKAYLGQEVYKDYPVKQVPKVIRAIQVLLGYKVYRDRQVSRDYLEQEELLGHKVYLDQMG